MVQLSIFGRFNRQFGLLLGLLFLLFSCRERLPEGIINQEKMVEVLFDVHLADGLLSTRPVDSARREMPSLYEAIFKRHDIDSTVLRQSVEYYASHPDVMKVMYTEIEARMEHVLQIEQDAISERYNLQRIADSIRMVHVNDSLKRAERQLRDVARKRHLLFLPAADTAYDASVPVTIETLRERMYEEIQLDKNYVRALHGTAISTDTVLTPEPTTPGPIRPDRPQHDPTVPRKLQLEEVIQQ